MRNTYIPSCLAIAAILAASCASSGEHAAAGGASRPGEPSVSLPPLLLPCGETSLDPAAMPAFRNRLAEGKDADDSAVYILQYDTGATRSSAVRKAVRESGAILLDPVSGGAYLARATPAQCLAILDSVAIAAAREYGPGDKIAAAAAWGQEPPDPAVCVVSLFSDADHETVAGELAALDGCEVLETDGTTVRVRLHPAGFMAVSALHSVLYIAPFLEPTPNQIHE